eukprot:SAG11_NODE_142_length_14906_cov_8.352333_11_plen_124_part_00
MHFSSPAPGGGVGLALSDVGAAPTGGRSLRCGVRLALILANPSCWLAPRASVAPKPAAATALHSGLPPESLGRGGLTCLDDLVSRATSGRRGERGWAGGDELGHYVASVYSRSVVCTCYMYVV